MIELKLWGQRESKVVMIMSLEAEGRRKNKMEVVGYIHQSQIIEFHLTSHLRRGDLSCCLMNPETIDQT